MKRGLPWLAVMCVFVCAADLRAQAPWPIAVEAYLGATRGFSSSDRELRGSRSGALADALVGARLHGADRAGAFVAINGTIHGVNTVRTLDCLLAPDGGCVPWFPEIAIVSLLGGWESESTLVRILGGPGVVSSDARRTVGIVSRLDIGLPLIGRTALMASVNALIVPSLDGDRFHYFAAGLGLRVR